MADRNKFATISSLLLCLIASFGIAQDDEKNPQELFAEAREATANQDFEKAAEILKKLEEKVPGNAMIQFNLGYNLHAAGKLDEAIEYHIKSSENEQFKPTAFYNLACAYSIKDEKDKAFDYLKQSIEAGFRQVDQTETDPDFKNIKDDPRFGEMITMMKNDGEMPEKVKAEDLFGSWKVESGMRSGSKIGSDRLPTIKIDKKAFTIPSGPGSDPFVMSYKIDFDAKPITVDFKIESGPVPDGKAKGIIKMEDEKMVLCYHPMEAARPEKFVSTEENGFFLFKMKKAEEKTEVKSAKTLATNLVGKWKCSKGLRAGKKVEANRMESVITMDEKLITIPVGEDQKFVMSFKIDESKSPATIDMKIEEGPAPPGSQAIGIIKMYGKKAVLCYDPMGANRPEKFESSESNGFFLFEMERASD